VGIGSWDNGESYSVSSNIPLCKVWKFVEPWKHPFYILQFGKHLIIRKPCWNIERSNRPRPACVARPILPAVAHGSPEQNPQCAPSAQADRAIIACPKLPATARGFCPDLGFRCAPTVLALSSARPGLRWRRPFRCPLRPVTLELARSTALFYSSSFVADASCLWPPSRPAPTSPSSIVAPRWSMTI
jgi:hypothetical protein